MRRSSAIGANAANVIPLHRDDAEAMARRRAVAYVRESTEEQGKGFLPDGQRQAIARYAEEHGLSLVDEYLDFGDRARRG